MNIFILGQKLLKGVFYSEVIENVVFIYYRSVFKENFYNLLIPNQRENTIPIDWPTIQCQIKTETELGRGVSLYISEDQIDKSQSDLLNHGYKKDIDDLYVWKELDKKYEIPSLDFIEVNESNLNLFIQASAECFPDFPNNTEYCEFCFKISSTGIDKRNLNVLIMVNNQVAAFGSVLVSRELKIAYLHNLGTLAQFRRRGYFDALVKYLSNYAFQNGASIIYANVEDGGASHNGFTKLGYKKDSKFYHFIKI